MDEYDPNEDLLEKLMNAESFNDIGMSQKKILGRFKKVIKDLLFYKDQVIALRLQLQLAKESHKLLKKEFGILKIEPETFATNNKLSCYECKNQQLNNLTEQKIDQIKFLEKRILYLEEENLNLKSQIKVQESQAKEQCMQLKNQIEKRNKTSSNTKKEQKKDTRVRIRVDKSVQLIHGLNTKDLNFEAQQRVRARFCRIISEKSNQVNHSIANLYFVLTGNQNNQMRPLILSMVFIVRWRNIKIKKIPFDQNSLMVFTSNQHTPFGLRVDTILKTFKSLTSELANTKEKLIQNLHTTQKVSHNLNEVSSELNMNKDKYKVFQDQIKFYKSKIANMNEEVSSMVSPDKFKEVLQKNSDLEIQIDRLNQKIEELEEKINEKNNEVNEYRNKYQKAEFLREIDLSQKDDDKKQIDQQKMEINALNVRLKNQSKDLLSYERMSSNINKTFFIRQNPIYANHYDTLEPDFTKENINPKFLPNANV